MSVQPPELVKGKGRWEKIGNVSVDSGTLAVVDPCYVIDKGEEIYGLDQWDEDYKVKPYSSYCDKLGVQFFSGFGDGGYDVWAYIADMGDWGERVARVVVCMIDEEPEEEEWVDVFAALRAEMRQLAEEEA